MKKFVFALLALSLSFTINKPVLAQNCASTPEVREICGSHGGGPDYVIRETRAIIMTMQNAIVKALLGKDSANPLVSIHQDLVDIKNALPAASKAIMDSNRQVQENLYNKRMGQEQVIEQYKTQTRYRWDPVNCQMTTTTYRYSQALQQVALQEDKDASGKAVGARKDLEDLGKARVPAALAQGNIKPGSVYTPTVREAAFYNMNQKHRKKFGGRGLTIESIARMGQREGDKKAVVTRDEAAEVMFANLLPTAKPPEVNDPSPGLIQWLNSDMAKESFREAARRQMIEAFMQFVPADGLKEQLVAIGQGLQINYNVNFLTPDEQSAPKISVASFCGGLRRIMNGPAMLTTLASKSGEELQRYDILRQTARDCRNVDENMLFLRDAINDYNSNVSSPPGSGTVRVQ